MLNSTPATSSGINNRERSSARMGILQRLAAPFAGDGDDVLDADEQVHDSEARDEAAQERIHGQRRQRGIAVPQRADVPYPRPWHDDEEQSRLEAVEGKEEGEGHYRADSNVGHDGGGPKSTVDCRLSILEGRKSKVEDRMMNGEWRMANCPFTIRHSTFAIPPAPFRHRSPRPARAPVTTLFVEDRKPNVEIRTSVPLHRAARVVLTRRARRRARRRGAVVRGRGGRR